MGGIASNPQVQNAINTSPQQPGQVQQPGQTQQPFPGMPMNPQIPGQVRTPNYTNPDMAPSQYGNYGFDPGLQSYLDNQYRMSTVDAGVGFQYDPTNQTFTGGTRTGQYNPIPLNVMQQAAGGNRDVLNPYFQSRFPQPTSPVPTVKPRPDLFIDPARPGSQGPRPGPIIDPRRPMPGRPMPQFDPRRSGLGALQQMLAGQQVTPGRPALPPGLNGVPGNQNPLYFGPGYK
jgi:hypothetical protein